MCVFAFFYGRCKSIFYFQLYSGWLEVPRFARNDGEGNAGWLEVPRFAINDEIK